MPKPRKPRVIWGVQDVKGFIQRDGLVLGIWYPTKRHASQWGKPVKFVEAVK